MHQASINQPYNLQPNNNLGNNLNHINSMQYDASPNANIRQQYINWQKAKELLEKKERGRIDSQIKQADEWLSTLDQHMNRTRNTAKYQQPDKAGGKQAGSNQRK